MNCDTCGCWVSSKGHLGGSIVCHRCSRAKRTGDVETLQWRIDEYGGGDDYNGQDVSELVY